jgi:hypothetical protein
MDEEWQMSDVLVMDILIEPVRNNEPPRAGHGPQTAGPPPQPSQAPAGQQVPTAIRNRWFVTTPLPPLVPTQQMQSFRYNRLGAREFPSAYLYLMQQGNVVFNGNRQRDGGAVTAAHGRFSWTWKEVPWKWEPWWNLQPAQPGYVMEPVLELVFNRSGDTTKLWRHIFHPQHYPAGSWFFDSGTTQWNVIIHQF